MGKLTEKRKLFCEELLIDENGTQAAIRAGFSEKTAKEQAYRLLNDEDVKAYLDELRQKRSKRLGVTQDRVLSEMARIGFSDPRKLLDDDGNLLNPKDWPDDAAAAVASFEMGKGKDGKMTVTKLKLLDKRTILDNLARHLGLYDKDRLHVEGNVEVLIKKFTYEGDDAD